MAQALLSQPLRFGDHDQIEALRLLGDLKDARRYISYLQAETDDEAVRRWRELKHIYCEKENEC